MLFHREFYEIVCKKHKNPTSNQQLTNFKLYMKVVGFPIGLYNIIEF